MANEPYDQQPQSGQPQPPQPTEPKHSRVDTGSDRMEHKPHPISVEVKTHTPNVEVRARPVSMEVTSHAVGTEAKPYRPNSAAGPGPVSPVVRAQHGYRPSPLVIAVLIVLTCGLVGVTAWAISLSRDKDAALHEKSKLAEQAREADKKIRDAEKITHDAQQRIRDAEKSAWDAESRARDAKNTRAVATNTWPATDIGRQGKTRVRDTKAATDLVVASQWLDPALETENQRSTYVTNIRLAKQAWDRGDTAQVCQILEPYRTDAEKQKLRNFAWYYLWRAAHSGGSNVIRGHTQAVRHATFNREGTSVVTLGDDGSLAVWDPATGKKQQGIALEQPSSSPRLYVSPEESLARQAGGLAVSPEGGWAAAYGKTTWVGDFKQQGQPRRFGEHTSPVIAMATTRDGRLLATSDYQGEIIVRELPDGRIVRRWKNPGTQALAFTRDAKTLQVGTQQGVLSVWDVATGALQVSESFVGGIKSLAVAPDGQTIAVALADREGVVCLWEPATGKVRGELRGHHDEVSHVAFSPDGKTLLTASHDQTARLWSASGSLLHTFTGHLGEVETADFSPDGRKVITAGMDRTAILWDIDNDQQSESLTDTPALGWINSLAFSPGADLLVGAGCCDGTDAFLGSWNLADSNRPTPLQTKPKTATAMGFAPNSKLMAIGVGASADATAASYIRIWNLEASSIAATVPGLTGCVNSTTYSPDGRLLIAALGNADERMPGTVRIWDAATGTPRQTLSDLPGRPEAVFTPDGKLLVTVTASKVRPADIRLWNPATGELLGRIEAPRELEGVTSMALAPDGRVLVTGHGDPANPLAPGRAKLRLWDLANKRFLGEFPPAHAAAISRLAFSRRGLLLASGDAAGTVRIWEFPDRKLLLKQLPAQGHPITGLAFDLYGERIVTAAEEKCVRVWHVDTARALAKLELAVGTPAIIRFTPDGKSLVGTTTAGGLIAWDAETYRPRALRGERDVAGQEGHKGEVTCAATPLVGGRLPTGGADKTVRLWDLQARKFEPTAVNLKQGVACMAVSPEGRILAIGTGRYKTNFEPGEVILWQLGAAGSEPRLQTVLKGIAVSGLAFTPDGGALALCGVMPDSSKGLRQEAVLMNLATGRAVELASNLPQSVAVAPDGRLLAIGRATGEIDLWRIESSAPAELKPRVLQGHRGAVDSLGFSPDGKTLVSGGCDNNAKVWDVATGEELLTFKHNGAVEAVRFSPDGKILATADHDAVHGGVRLWRAADDEVRQVSYR